MLTYQLLLLLNMYLVIATCYLHIDDLEVGWAAFVCIFNTSNPAKMLLSHFANEMLANCGPEKAVFSSSRDSDILCLMHPACRFPGGILIWIVLEKGVNLLFT